VSTRRPDGLRPPQSLIDGLRRIEDSEALDAPAGVIERAAGAVVRPGVVHDLLTGAWLGHAVHPLMTDLPIGFWTSASVLDVMGGRRGRPAADLLLAIGTVSAVPTVATGLAEFVHADRAARRVAVVHVAANAAGTALYAGSLVSRLRGRRGRGVVLALAGAAAATLGGYVGGHLSTARKVGTRDPAFGPDPAGVPAPARRPEASPVPADR
jgi:uncharacterized membrane protein